jgi:hypothetical protein
MADGTYDTIAAVYDVLVPDALLTRTAAPRRARSTGWRRRAAPTSRRWCWPGRRSQRAAGTWTIPPAWDAPHAFEVAVALVADDGAVPTHRERFAFWPFTEEELLDDLRAVGLQPAVGEAPPDDKAERYLVTARRG